MTQGGSASPQVVTPCLHNASRRTRWARHASGDAPYHASAKHHILEACFFRMTPSGACYSPCRVVCRASLQGLRAYLHTLRSCDIPTLRLHGALGFRGSPRGRGCGEQLVPCFPVATQPEEALHHLIRS